MPNETSLRKAEATWDNLTLIFGELNLEEVDKDKRTKAKKPKTLKSNSLLSYLNLTENRPKESPNVSGAAMSAQKKRYKLAQKHTAFKP